MHLKKMSFIKLFKIFLNEVIIFLNNSLENVVVDFFTLKIIKYEE